jgi:CIC family chloride channel protein
MKREAASGLIRKFKFTEQTQACEIGGGYKIMEIEAPRAFWDLTLKELDLKARYRIDVLLIKRKYPPRTITIPGADEVIKRGDQLILAGLEQSLTRINGDRDGSP